MADRIVHAKQNEEDGRFALSLRPKRLAEYLGQDKIKQNLRILIEAARSRGEAIDHILLCGPFGIGKRTLANIVAAEMGVSVKNTSASTIERTGDLAAILTNLRAGDILFVDEVHRLNQAVEEVLYPALENFTLDITIGKGPSARSLRLPLPRFTLVAATTRYTTFSASLVASFGIIFHFDLYAVQELEIFVQRAAKMLDIPIDGTSIGEIARRARGTPRVAIRLLKRVRDYAQVRAAGIITAAIAQQALAIMGLDSLGLDDIDRKILHTIMIRFNGGPVGLESLSSAISENVDMIMDVYEPYLFQLGFVDRTPRGRVATPNAYKHLGVEYPEPTDREKLL